MLANDTVIDGVASLTVLAPPAHGTALVNPDQTITYTPDPGFVGTDTFTYQVIDTDGQTGTASVTVTVQPADSGFPVAAATRPPRRRTRRTRRRARERHVPRPARGR